MCILVDRYARQNRLLHGGTGFLRRPRGRESPIGNRTLLGKAPTDVCVLQVCVTNSRKGRTDMCVLTGMYEQFVQGGN